MELPSAESIGKFFGGLIVALTAGWVLVKRYLPSSKEEEIVEQPSKVFKRAEDAGYRILEERILKVERDFNNRINDERAFLMEEIRNSESVLTGQIQEVGRRIDTHNQGINERLDLILGRIK